MDTQHIGYIRRVAELRNISAAARELEMTQPALTKIVSRVEDLIGARLFDRRPRGVALTAMGAAFLHRMARVEQEMLGLSREVHAMKQGRSGTVSIAVGQFWIGRILPQVVAELSVEAPEVQVKIRTGARDEMLTRLQRGEFDFVLGRITEDLPDGMIGEALAEVRLYLTVGAQHPLAALDRPVTPDDLQPYGWVLPPPGDPTAQHVNRVFRDLAFEPNRIAVEAVSHSLIIGLLHTTDLITAMPEITINTLGDGLRRLECDWLRWSRKAGVISVRDRSRLPCCDQFLRVLRRVTAPAAHGSG